MEARRPDVVVVDKRNAETMIADTVKERESEKIKNARI